MPLENMYAEVLLTFLKCYFIISFWFLRYRLYIIDNILYIYGFDAELYSKSLSSTSGWYIYIFFHILKYFTQVTFAFRSWTSWNPFVMWYNIRIWLFLSYHLKTLGFPGLAVFLGFPQATLFTIPSQALCLRRPRRLCPGRLGRHLESRGWKKPRVLLFCSTPRAATVGRGYRLGMFLGPQASNGAVRPCWSISLLQTVLRTPHQHY